MKAGLVWRGFPKESRLEKYLERFASALSAAGHPLLVYTSKSRRICGFPNSEIRTLNQSRPRPFADAFAALQSRNECDFLLSTEPVWDCDCYLALRGVHRTRLEEWKKAEPAAWHWLRRQRDNGSELLALEEKAFLSGFAKNVVVGSEMVKGEIVRHFDFPADRIAVVYEGTTPGSATGAELDALRSESRGRLGLAAEDYVVFCGDPGLEEREYRFAIEGINRVNLAQPVLLVPCRENHWAYPRSRRTRFLGQTPDMASLFAAADIFLLPVVYDPFSKTGLAAFAAGVPVITTRTNGFSELIEPGVNGEVLREPADPEAVARAIEAWSDPDKRRAIKPRLTKLAMQFDPEANLKTALALLDHCVVT